MQSTLAFPFYFFKSGFDAGSRPSANWTEKAALHLTFCHLPSNTTKATFHSILIILSFQGSRKSLNFAVTPSPIMADMILVFTKTAWRKIYSIYGIFLSFCPLVIAKVIWNLVWHWARRIPNLQWLFKWTAYRTQWPRHRFKFTWNSWF